MDKSSESTENWSINKKATTNNAHFLASVHSLLDSISEKDESVRNAIELALGRMAETKPSETFAALCDFRQKHPKLGEQQIAIILRVIEKFTLTHTKQLIDDDIIRRIIDLVIGEITKTQDICVAVQRPGVESLVSIGRVHCDKVMERLTNQLVQGNVTHFMILNSMGALAIANISGIIGYLKQTLETILPTLSMIKVDHIKQAYAFAIGRFAEAITEHSTQKKEQSAEDSFQAEIAIAYEVFLNQWLPNRELKVSSEILQALSHMYQLLSSDKIAEQAPKVVPQLLAFYRRSMDRNAITQLLASILKTTIDQNTILDSLADVLISSLFDLVTVNPDYEKPQTVKGHYEVLRCFDLLVEIYSTKILDMLLIQIRSNNERERIKSLLVLTHLTNTYDHLIRPKIGDYLPLLKFMMNNEKHIKMKMVLLKTIVAFAQKSLISDKVFVQFILRHCCQLNKANTEHGTLEEHNDLYLACNNSLFMLATTVGTMDDLLKSELLQYYLVLDYTDACTTIVKCLTKLFAKSTTILTEESSSSDTTSDTEEVVKSAIPSPESVFLRSLTLLGNTNDSKRSENILLFLKNYSPIINKHLRPQWLERIPELLLLLQKKDEFLEQLYKFLITTIKDVDDFKFSESLVNKSADQIVLYPNVAPVSDFVIPSFVQERGMLMKILGISLCYVSDNQTVEAKIDLIINMARQEALDKHVNETRLSDFARSLGFAAKIHTDIVLKKLDALHQEEGSRKSSGSFFASLNFIKDSSKTADLYKINLLSIESYEHIVQMAPQNIILKDIDTKIISFLHKQLCEVKDFTLKKMTLQTLLTITRQLLKSPDLHCELKLRSNILVQLLKIDSSLENLPLFATVLTLATALIQLKTQFNVANQSDAVDDPLEINNFFEEYCRKFFSCAQQLKNKFESVEEDDRNSLLAKYLNLSLPELNLLVRAIFENNASPSTLDDVMSVLDYWIKDKNSEVRICAGHVMNNALEFYIKNVKIGCEAPSKFNQTGSMLAKIVPRCIDPNATVRQTSIDILQKILEISCIYESLTIANENTDWIRDLQKIREEIATDDPKEIYRIAGEIASVIALRLSNFQYLQFCKSLLHTLNDTEQSSSIGSSVVLKYFIQIKGSELFHAVPEIVKEALHAVNICTSSRAKSGVLKSLVALTKHHPKLVCTEMLSQPLPFENNVIEYWKALANDPGLCGIIIDNFLSVLSSSCLYEQFEGCGDRQLIAAQQPFAIFCALHEILACKELQQELMKRFPEIFAMLLTTLATYTNLAAPHPVNNKLASPTTGKVTSNSGKSKFGFAPNKDAAAVKINPCLIVLETFQYFLNTVEMEQITAVLAVYPNLATSTELNNFMELLTPIAVALVNQNGIVSSVLKQTVIVLSKYVSSPYDPQRIAAIGLYSQLVPLKPVGEISSVIMLHLSAALSDPNPLVRGFCVRGLAFVGDLNEHDIDKYSEITLSALLKGVDDYNVNCLINIPLESLKGLSRVLKTLPSDKLETFQVSLAIRIRPFFENQSEDIREAAILLFGDLCQSKIRSADEFNETFDEDDIKTSTTDALREQLFSNFFSMLLHLCETNGMIVRACKITLRKVCTLINAPKVNAMVQSHLLEHGQLNYEMFIADLIKLIAEELNDNISDFIESCLPFLKSTWPEIRGNAAIIIGLLHNLNKTNQQSTENVSQKIAILLRDEQIFVRIKAAHALGYMFGDLSSS